METSNDLGITKPFAGYKDFDECVLKNKDKSDPEAYCASIKQKVEGKTPTLNILMPLIKKDGKIIATLTDDSLDRDEELMSPDLIKSFSNKGVLTALFNHDNKMENWAGGFKDTSVIQKSIDGVTRSSLSAEFVPLTSNPNTSWVVEAINEAESKGIPLPSISIGAIPYESKMIKLGGKDYKMWTKAELCEASLVPYGSNRNANLAIAKAIKTLDLIKEINLSEKRELKKMDEDLKKSYEDEISKTKVELDLLKNEIAELQKNQKKKEPKKEEPKKDEEKKDELKSPEVKTPEKPVIKKEPVIIENKTDIVEKSITCLDLIKKAYGRSE